MINLFHPYGAVLAAAGLAGLFLMQTVTGKKLKSGTVSWFAVTGIPLAVLCGRLGYVLATLDTVGDRSPIAYFFDFTGGGMMFYGAAAGLLSAGALTGKITRQKTVRILDAAAAPMALLVFAARLAEPLVGQGYGHNIQDWFDPFMEMSMFSLEDVSFFCRFPFGMQDAFYATSWNWAVWPLEALTALVLFAALLRTRPGTNGGGRILLFFLCYAAMQATLESMRQDDLLKLGNLGFVKVNQLLTVPVLAAVTGVCARKIPEGQRARTVLPAAAVMLLCCGVVMAMEFALDQKIGFLKWMRMDLCYLVMAAASAGIILAGRPMIRRAAGVTGA